MAESPRVVMYAIPGCGYCAAARRLLNRRGVAFEEHPGDPSPHGRRRMARTAGGTTFPQILIDGEPIGGYRELRRFARSGGLGEAPPRAPLWRRLLRRGPDPAAP